MVFCVVDYFNNTVLMVLNYVWTIFVEADDNTHMIVG